MTDSNRLLQYMQTAQSGGSPYDEESYMPQDSAGPVNRLLGNRLQGRMQPQMLEYMHGGYPGYGEKAYQPRSSGSPGGSDMDMMEMYGPEDQVAYDNIGRPIPLSDPRHPRNQMPAGPSYPQRR